MRNNRNARSQRVTLYSAPGLTATIGIPKKLQTKQRKTEAGAKSGAEPAETRGAPRRHKHQAVQPPRRTGEGGDRRPEVPLTQRHIT